MTADRAVIGVVLVGLGLVFLFFLSHGFSALTHTVGIAHLTSIDHVVGSRHIVHSIGHGVHTLTRFFVPAVLIGLGVFLVRRAN